MKNYILSFFCSLVSLFATENLFAQLPTMVKDINIGDKSSGIETMCITENGLFFSAYLNNQKYLWYTDGTESGTIPLHIVSSIKYTPYIYFNGVMYYSYNPSNISPVGADLWRSDGTLSGTYKLKDHVIGPESEPNNFAIYNNKVYYSFVNSIGNAEIWSTDGSTAGTQRVINLGVTVNRIQAMKVFKNEIYFIADTYIPNEVELRKTNGTIEGMSTVKTLNGRFSTFYQHQDKLYFTGYSDVTEQSNALWITDGTNQGTKKVVNLRLYSPIDLIANRAIVSYNDTLYFAADLGDGTQVWKTDGTFNGTNRLKTFNGIFTSSQPNLTVVNNLLFYHAVATTAGQELYKSNGTNEGTVKVDLLGNKMVATFNEVGFNNKLYFSAKDRFGNFGSELWVTDGSYENTKMVVDLLEGPASSAPNYLIANENQLFFTAGVPNHGNELCVIDKRNTSFNSIKFESNFTIYPNPTSGILKFNNTNISKAEIFNIQGSLVKIIENNFDDVYINDLIDGIYFVKIYNREQQPIKSQKIILINN